MNSYQRLKKKLQESEKEKNKIKMFIAGRLDFIESLSIKKMCEMEFQINDIIWQGNITKNK